MPADSHRAVFLSYASQDAEAARRIADALRAAGIEVWFDVEGGLETGDEWDAKIRRQIKECLLFIPVISAATQARDEGYFRIEWDLAAERARGIAGGVPFILPVVIDATREPDALVPDRFRSVQWTRAAGGELTAETRAKFAQLWSHRAGLLKEKQRAGSDPLDAPETSSPSAAPSAPPRRLPPVALWLSLGAVGVAVGTVFFVTSRRSAPPAPAATAAAAVPAAREWPRHPELKRAMALLDGINAIPEDFRLAEEIVRRVADAAPTDPEAVTAMARVHGLWLLRGWDRGAERRAAAKATAERALQLAPDEPEALIALAAQLFERDSESRRAYEAAQRAVDLAPGVARYHRMRDSTLFWQARASTPAEVVASRSDAAFAPLREKALASARRTAALFPRDALARYDLSRHLRNLGEWEECEQVIDETLALVPVANALSYKARFRFGLHNDLAGMRAFLDQVPARVRVIERTVLSYFMYSVHSGDTGPGLDALREFNDPWLADFEYRGPRALLEAELLAIAGKTQTAKLLYEAALGEVRKQRSDRPGSGSLLNIEAWCLYGLGRSAEARTAYLAYNETFERPYTIGPTSSWWFQIIPANLLFGDRAFALAMIREACASFPRSREILRLRFELDPRMATFRADPEIVAILGPARSAAAPAATAAPAAAVPDTEAARLAARARALYSKLGYTREDLATAEDLARRATVLEPGNAAAWGTYAAVHGTYLQRGWDLSDKRRAAAQQNATRALGLDPAEPEALYGLGYAFSRQNTPQQALDAFARAAAAAPADNRIARAYANSLLQNDRTDECRAVLEAARRRDPKDPLIHYSLAQTYLIYGPGGEDPARLAACLKHLDDGIAAEPLATLLLQKATMLAGWKGDFAGARAVLDQLERRPLSERVEDRAVYIPLWLATLERDPRRAAAAELTARNYFEDLAAMRRPKDWHVALVRRSEGKENLARLAWQRAEGVIRERLKDNTVDLGLQWELACTLAWLGRAEEADRTFAPIEAAWREEMIPFRAARIALYAAARGDGAKTALHLPAALNCHPTFTRHTLPRDPWFDLVREHPDVQRVLATPAPSN